MPNPFTCSIGYNTRVIQGNSLGQRGGIEERLFQEFMTSVHLSRHPLAKEELELLDYDAGMATIDWLKMNARDYHDEESKSVCMAECLSPKAVPAVKFFDIFVPDFEIKKAVAATLIDLKCANLFEIKINSHMFLC